MSLSISFRTRLWASVSLNGSLFLISVTISLSHGKGSAVSFLTPARRIVRFHWMKNSSPKMKRC